MFLGCFPAHIRGISIQWTADCYYLPLSQLVCHNLCHNYARLITMYHHDCLATLTPSAVITACINCMYICPCNVSNLQGNPLLTLWQFARIDCTNIMQQSYVQQDCDCIDSTRLPTVLTELYFCTQLHNTTNIFTSLSRQKEEISCKKCALSVTFKIESRFYAHKAMSWIC